MLHSARVGDFRPSTHGLPWANSYPVGTPVYLFETPFGPFGVPDASRGLCGGMIYTVVDLQRAGSTSIPQTYTEPGVFNHICRRLLQSWGLPFAWMKYWGWQNRPNRTKSIAGVPVQKGAFDLTIEEEWPKIRAKIDTAELVPLGLVNVTGFSPLKLGLNHQVLAYGYDFDDATGEATIHIYDPNYPGDDTATLKFNVNDLAKSEEIRIAHSCTGPTIRGVFATDYKPPKDVPEFLKAASA